MERPTRRLAAILAADIAGYTRLMQSDEAGTHAELKRLHAAIVEPALAARNGRIVKTTGDGFLAEFASVVDAAGAAIDIQRQIGEVAAAAPADRRFLFRMGINIGDVIVDGGDIFGDGVNLAARLEQVAQPGGICVSAAAQQQLQGRIDATLQPLGAMALKNMREPVQVFAIAGVDAAPSTPKKRRALPTGRTMGALAALAALSVAAAIVWVAFPDLLPGGRTPAPVTAATQPAAPASARPVIAVLPLANLSGDASQDYFADGLTEDLIGDLGRFSSLAVLARPAVEHLRGGNLPLAEAMRKLGVRYFVQGSVRRTGERTRLSLQLTDAGSGTVLWAHQFDAGASELFAVQDQIVNQLAGRLASQVAMVETRRSAAKPTDSLEAYDHALHGRALLVSQTRSANVQAREHFRKAMALDPRFAAAYAGAAATYLHAVILGWTQNPDETLDEAEALARQALERDASTVSAYVVLARVATLRGNHEQALELSRQAIAINSSDAQAFKGLGTSLVWVGKAEEAVGAFEMARNLGETFTQPDRFHFGLAHFSLRRYERALEVVIDPVVGQAGLPASLALLAAIHSELGDMEKARLAYAQLRRHAPFFEIERFGENLADAEAGLRLREALRRAAAS